MNLDYIDPEVEELSAAHYKKARENLAMEEMIQAVETVAERYRLPKDVFSVRLKTLLHLARLAHFLEIPFNKLERLKEVSVVDVACGRQANADPNFSPWFCRVTHQLGCAVTGIDIPMTAQEKAAGLDAESEEPWTFVPLDLRNPNALWKFPENYFDVAHCTYFIGNQGKQRDDDPKFRESFGEDFHAYNNAQKNIIYHMNRMIKPNGVVIHNDSKRDKF